MPAEVGEILGHAAEGFQDHGVFEFAEVRIAAAREGDRARVRFVERHGVRAPDGGGAIRTFHGLAGGEPAFNGNKGQCHVIDRDRPRLLAADRNMRERKENMRQGPSSI